MSEITIIERLNELFDDIKKLKKYRNLEKDIDRAVEAIKTDPSNFHGAFLISGLGFQSSIKIFKLKNFRSTDMPGKGSRSGIRLIYGYDSTLNKLFLIEIYYHDRDDSDCDKERIKKYFSIN